MAVMETLGTGTQADSRAGMEPTEYLRRLRSLVLALDQYRSSNWGRPRLCGGGISKSADDEDRLAGAARPAAAFEGLPPFGQREGLADHRSQPSRVGHLRQPG